MCLYFTAGIALHRTVVICHPQYQCLCYVDSHGSVVVEGTLEWQIYSGKHDKKYRQYQDKQNNFLIIILVRYKIPNTSTVQDGQRYVKLTNKIIFKLVLKLSQIVLTFTTYHKTCHKYHQYTQYHHNGAEDMELCICCLYIRIFHMYATAEKYVVGAEHYQCCCTLVNAPQAPVFNLIVVFYSTCQIYHTHTANKK